MILRRECLNIIRVRTLTMDVATIRNFALANAIKYGGKANPGAIVGVLIANDPSVKDQLKHLSKEIAQAVKDVNALTPEAQLAELQKSAPELLAPRPKEEKRHELPPLPDAIKGNVVTRIAPEPSKYMHLGHAVVALVNYLEAKRFDGKVVLRFDETNPDKSTEEYLASMRDDLAWHGVTPDTVVFASDLMHQYYDAAERLIKQKDAYVCFCAQEVMRDLRFKGISCSCKDASVEENLADWAKMKDGSHAEGKCVLRFVGDMQNPNGTLRDPVIMRIVHAPHFRHGTTYKAWPMYDFATPIAETHSHVTHLLRSAEFEQRIELQDLLRHKLDLPPITAIQFGRINVMGATTQGREIRELVQSGSYLGWDDPRLVTLKTLRRRGILPQALQELVYGLGFDKGQVNLDYSIVAAINRKLIDDETDRLFFLANPVPITISDAPAQKVELHKHPDHPERGQRILTTTDIFLLSADDVDRVDTNGLYRLMECLNFRKDGTKYVFDSTDLETYKKDGKGIMHWLPHQGNVSATVMMPDATLITGVVEPAVKELKPGQRVQFERFGFCVLDRIENDTYHFWFTHK
mgnify:CR=1 FL=1